MSKKDLGELKLEQERKILAKFNKEIALNSNKICFGVKDTMELLDMGAVQTLIISSKLNYQRIELQNPKTKEITFKYLRPEEMENIKKFYDVSGKIPLKVLSKVELLEWLTEEGASLVSNIQFISSKSPEGHSFNTGYGGIGGLLRYEINLNDFDYGDPGD